MSFHKCHTRTIVASQHLQRESYYNSVMKLCSLLLFWTCLCIFLCLITVLLSLSFFPQMSHSNVFLCGSSSAKKLNLRRKWKSNISIYQPRCKFKCLFRWAKLVNLFSHMSHLNGFLFSKSSSMQYTTFAKCERFTYQNESFHELPYESKTFYIFYTAF